MGLKKNLLRVFSVNVLTLLTGVIIGFLVPSILSIDSYANVKTYTFYISYIGVLHLGFIDGMFLKYGGKDINNINKEELKSEHNFFIILQLIMALLFLGLAMIKKDFIIFLMSMSIIPINTFTFHKFLYQATGEFKKYAKISYLYTIIELVLTLILVIFIKSDDYIFYCLTSLIANIIVFLTLEYNFYKNYKDISGKYDRMFWKNIKVGIFILLGNLAAILFYAIDRWFVKIFFTSFDFAYYSFAVSMLNIISTLVSAVAVTFYNYLSKGEDKDKIKKLKNYFLIIGVFSSGTYFLLSGIVNLFLKKYIPSLDIIGISFLAYPYMIVINSLYVNLYKVRKEEKKYLKVVILMLSMAILLNTVAVLVFKNTLSIAMATTLSFIIWYLYSMKDFDYLKISVKEGIYLSIAFFSFLIVKNIFNWFLGGMLYIIIISLASFIIYKEQMSFIISIILKKLKIS